MPFGAPSSKYPYGGALRVYLRYFTKVAKYSRLGLDSFTGMEGDSMAKVYSRMTKISDVAGRSDYISNEKKQEYLIDHGKNRDFDWKWYSDYETAHQKSADRNNEARELVIALPNEMANLPSETRKEMAHDLATELLGAQRDYEYALHFNASRTNFHMHLLFSERESHSEAQIKRYKRDMWYDKETNRMAKANAPGAECRFKKGEPMKDKQGNFRFDSEPFSVKDPKFKSKAWLKDAQTQIQAVLKRHGYHLDLFNPETDIKQRKQYKGASAEYLSYASVWNLNAKKINQTHQQQLAPLLADRDRLARKLQQFDQERRTELNKKWLKTPAVKKELKALNEQRDDLIDEQTALITTYNLPFDPEGTHPKQVLEALNDLINRLVAQFKTMKNSMISQIGTIERAMAFKQSRDQPLKQNKADKTPPEPATGSKNGLNKRLDDLERKEREIHPEKNRIAHRRNKGGLGR